MPNPDVIDEIRRRLLTAADWEYFFSNLHDASWVEGLLKAGFFNDPPAPVRTEKYIQFPPWAASRWLVRIARQNPKGVKKAIETVPETENVSVRTDLVEAASLLPANL